MHIGIAQYIFFAAVSHTSCNSDSARTLNIEPSSIGPRQAVPHHRVEAVGFVSINCLDPDTGSAQTPQHRQHQRPLWAVLVDEGSVLWLCKPWGLVVYVCNIHTKQSGARVARVISGCDSQIVDRGCLSVQHRDHLHKAANRVNHKYVAIISARNAVYDDTTVSISGSESGHYG